MLIARRERPHPGAQLRLTDHNGSRVTGFATNTPAPLGGGWPTWRVDTADAPVARTAPVVGSRLRLRKDWPRKRLIDTGWASLRTA